MTCSPRTCASKSFFFASTLLLLLFSFARGSLAQSESASISGTIVDPQGALVPSAQVSIVNTATKVVSNTETNNAGVYNFPVLKPGSYRMLVTKQGFKQIDLRDVTLHVQDSINRNFTLDVGGTSETIIVDANSSSMSTTSPAVSTTVDREFVENMPLNGRSFQDLIQLAPGAVSSNGYYSIDGQRTDSNNFTVDGVSANLGGLNNSAGLNENAGALAGSSPTQTALGTTQSLASIDSLQEFKIQTSGYTAEYGRNPGGQVAFTTRSGTNDIHGTLFEYLRNTAFDANSAFSDHNGIPQAADHQNDFGGTIGGPLSIPKLYDGKDKTFFFFSYEGLRLLLPSFESEYVPTQAFRQWASPEVQPFLNSAPLPSPNSAGNLDGCTIPAPGTGQPTACDALFNYAYSYPNNLDNISARIDQNFGERFHVFVRYADTPSSVVTGAEQTLSSIIDVHSWTAGLTSTISTTVVDEFRFNYTHDGEQSVSGHRSIGGSMPIPRSLLIPVAYDGPFAYGGIEITVPGTPLFLTPYYGGNGTVQHQYQILDGLTWTRGTHSIKFGGDWRHLTPQWTSSPYGSGLEIGSLSDIQNGYVTSMEVSASAPGRPVFENFSMYAQDHWRISPRLSIDYGLRWDLNPPPGPSNGHYPITLTSSDLATATLAPTGSRPYKTDYHGFGPRFGFAWNAIQSTNHPVTVRGGFGIFYDTAQQTIGYAYAGVYPFSANGPTLNEVPLPLSNAVLAPPSLNVPIIPPYPSLNGLTSPNLTLPYAAQWNLSIDEALNSRNTLTASYVGNEGKDLLFTGVYIGAAGSPVNPIFANGLSFTYNGSKSNYNALQVQDTGRITNGLDVVASFTWAHALDNASSNFSFVAPIYGNSDNDLRRVFNLALNYQTPTAGSSRWERALTGGWVIANRFSTQSGYPLNILQTYEEILPNGTVASYYPDLVPGARIYLHGSAADLNGQAVPGNWRLNPDAFSAIPTDPTTGLPVRQGNLGRNFVRAPGFYALNTAVQRSFPIYERLHLIFRVEAFNIFNHPNYSSIDTFLPDSTFGTSNGNAGTIGSANPLYGMGAARSLQLSLKLQF
jgi:hypothetical protein